MTSLRRRSPDGYLARPGAGRSSPVGLSSPKNCCSECRPRSRPSDPVSQRPQASRPPSAQGAGSCLRCVPDWPGSRQRPGMATRQPGLADGPSPIRGRAQPQAGRSASCMTCTARRPGREQARPTIRIAAVRLCLAPQPVQPRSPRKERRPRRSNGPAHLSFPEAASSSRVPGRRPSSPRTYSGFSPSRDERERCQPGHGNRGRRCPCPRAAMWHGPG